jgi:hypothetical protein
MPGTPHELAQLAQACHLAQRHVDPGEWVWDDGTTITAQEATDVTALAAYLTRQSTREARNARGQRRGMKLLRRLLSAEQRRQLRNSKDFLVVGSLGGVYRLRPANGRTERVERHGTRWFVRESYCFHDDRIVPEEALPDADLTIAHLLLLVADEGEFLARANASTRRDQLWNGEYLRRMRRRHDLEPAAEIP